MPTSTVFGGGFGRAGCGSVAASRASADHPDGLGDFRQPIGPARTGEWVDWVFHITFSEFADQSQVTVWKDGRKAIDRFSPRTGTLYPDRASYVKIGYYRSTDISRDGTVYVDNWRVGRSGPRG